MGKKYIKLFRAIFTSGTALIINCLMNLILTPFITNAVGITAYGFVSLSKNFSQYAAMLTEALNSFSARYITLAHHDDKKDEAKIYFSSTFFGNVFISLVVTLLSIPAIMFIDKLLKIPEDLVWDVQMLMAFTAATFVITTLFAVYSTSAYIVNKLDVVGIFKALSYITEALALILFYRLFKAKILYVGVSAAAAAVVVGVSNYWITKRYTPYLEARKQDFRAGAVKTLVGDGIWTTLNSLGGTLNNGLDLLVCNLMLTAANMGQLAIAKTIYSIFSGLFTVVGTAFHPMFLKSYADGDKKTLLKELGISMKISGMFANLVFAGFFAFGLAFYKLWIPNEDIELIYLLTVINNITVIPGGPMQPLYYIYVLTLKKKLPTIVTIAGGLFNVIGMYFLIKYTNLSVYAVVWTTAVVMMVINFITNPIYMAYVLKFPLGIFYPNIVRNIISCAVLCALFKGFTNIFYPTSWITLALGASICAVGGSVIHMLITCNKEERTRLIKKVEYIWNTKINS